MAAAWRADVIRVWDGFLSLLAALSTALVVGVPLWGTFLALQNELLTPWGWVPLILLTFVGLIMVSSFLRKTSRGVHPLRDRRR